MPNWIYTINLADVWGADIPFEAKRDVIVRRLENSTWFYRTDYQLSLSHLIDLLKLSQDVQEFDDYWNQIYDIADYDRCWLGTF